MPLVEFPVFPIVHWAEKKAQSCAVVWEKGNSVFSSLPSSISWQSLSQFLVQAVSLMDFFAKEHRVIAYLGSDRFIGLLCYCGALTSGRQILMLNPAITEQQREQILQNNQIKILITDQLFVKFFENPTACKSDLNQVITPLDLHQPATLTLTSGSSGKPKAVVHTMAQHLANAQGVCDFMHFSETNSWLLSLPLFHVSGQGIVWRWLMQGATLYISETKNSFWHSLSKVSHASLVPTQLQRYLDWLGNKHISQHILLGGTAIPEDLIVQAQKQGITTYVGYGMTEMASTICAVKNERDNVGFPLANREVTIVENEIWVRGQSLALGYWNKGEIIPLTNQDGWFATKDRGAWNSQGKLTVLGRLDNMFISGGENIQPEEIEQILLLHPWVTQAFVVPVSDVEFGERPVAVVALSEPFHQQAVSSLQDFAKQRLEKFKQPIQYFPLDKGIEQGSGIKISRKQIKEYVAQRIRENHV